MTTKPLSPSPYIQSQWNKLPQEDFESHLKRIVLSSRIALIRNFDDKPFPKMCNPSDLSSVYSKTLGLLVNAFPKNKSMKAIPASAFVFGSNVVPKNFPDLEGIWRTMHKSLNDDCGFVYIDKYSSVLINTQDHLRIQSVQPGFCLKKTFKHVDKLDSAICNQTNIAFSEKFGYLTSNPENIGNGLRASVMLHIPYLSLLGESERICRTIEQMSFNVRSIYGKNAQVLDVAPIIQISNQGTLGYTEENVINKLSDIVLEVVRLEIQAYNHLYFKSPVILDNHYHRALAAGKNCYLISSDEALNILYTLKNFRSLYFFSGLGKDCDAKFDFMLNNFGTFGFKNYLATKHPNKNYDDIINSPGSFYAKVLAQELNDFLGKGKIGRLSFP